MRCLARSNCSAKWHCAMTASPRSAASSSASASISATSSLTSTTFTATASMSPHGSKHLAEPGGICVSRVVRDQVRDKVEFGFEDLGEQQVKNITRPVRVYRIPLAETGRRQAPLL